MENRNLDRLAHWLTLASQGNQHNINDPYYQPLYFEIFFNELDRNKTALNSETFTPHLIEKLQKHAIQEQIIKDQLTNFQNTWNAWVDLYQELKKRSKN